MPGKEEKTALIIGGVLVGAWVLFSLYQKQQAAQQTQLQQQLSNIGNSQPVSTLGDLLGGIGSAISSGSLSSLTDAFSSTGASNQPGLISSDDSSDDLNDPGLTEEDDEDYGD